MGITSIVFALTYIYFLIFSLHWIIIDWNNIFNTMISGSLSFSIMTDDAIEELFHGKVSTILGFQLDLDFIGILMNDILSVLKLFCSVKYKLDYLFYIDMKIKILLLPSVHNNMITHCSLDVWQKCVLLNGMFHFSFRSTFFGIEKYLNLNVFNFHGSGPLDISLVPPFVAGPAYHCCVWHF
ncbi:hypothetical protein C0J52_13367 [Blattella germanica]|nr:hypothetical protein C0J52_13367 [Blattella germanica]